MIEAVFVRVFAWTAAHKRALFGAVALVIAASAVLAARVRFDNDIAGLMPADPQLRRDFALIRENVFAGKVVLSFELADDRHSLEDLARYADTVAARLPGPWVTEVVRGPNLEPGVLSGLLATAPALVGAERLRTWAATMTPARISERLGEAKRQMLGFQGMFAGRLLSADPLGLFAPELGALQRMASAFGSRVVFYNGHFASADGRHLMMILGTPVPLTDGTRSAGLLEHIRNCLADRPAFARVDVVAGHTHTVANETLIKQDITRTATVATVAFLVVLIGFFRDWRAGVFFLIPAFAILIALVCAAGVFGSVSALVVALSTVIIGIADDFGIHVYTAIRTSGRRDIVAQIARPILLAALFTSGIFLVFFLSTIPGYRQLAFITLTSIWFCVGFVLLVFPHLVTLAPMKLPGFEDRGGSRSRDWLRVGIWGALLLVLAVGAARMRFSSSVATLDGAPQSVRDGERRFEEVWLGGESQGVFVAEAPTRDQALALNRRLYRDSAAVSGRIASIAPLWAPESERRENAAAWKTFWSSAGGRSLADRVRASALRAGFSARAFAPFFGLTERAEFPDPSQTPLLAQLAERFVSTVGPTTRVFTYFPEEPALRRHFETLARTTPGTFVFSAAAFERRFSESIRREAGRLALFALILLAGVAAVFLRRVRLAVMALAAAATCVLAVAALFGFAGMPLTAPAVVALMIAVGLSINYGVFMLYSLQHGLDTGSAKAIVISAATTLIGALSLLAARHPALFSIGVAMSAGLGAGWLCAELVVPALYRLTLPAGADHV